MVPGGQVITMSFPWEISDSWRMVKIGRDATDAFGLRIDLSAPLLLLHACGIVSTCGHTVGPSLVHHSSLQGRQLLQEDLGRAKGPGVGCLISSWLSGLHSCPVCSKHIFLRSRVTF